jgi:hypothetical protein
MNARELKAGIEANLGPGTADVVLGSAEPTEQQLRAVCGAQSREDARATLLDARRALRPVYQQAVVAGAVAGAVATPTAGRTRARPSARRRREVASRRSSSSASRGDPDLADSEPEPPLAPPRAGGPLDDLSRLARTAIIVVRGVALGTALERTPVVVGATGEARP